MNAHQRRKDKRKVWHDHFRWPLGTRVQILPGHHTPEVVGMTATVLKHGYPCQHRVNCLIQFPHPVIDRSAPEPFERFAHYVEFKHLRKVKP